MSSQEEEWTATNNVIPISRARSYRLSPPKTRARVYIVEDDHGELEFGIDEVDPGNALRFLQPMLYLSGVLLKAYRG